MTTVRNNRVIIGRVQPRHHKEIHKVDNILHTVKQGALEICRQIEQQPVFDHGDLEFVRQRRYPFERELQAYIERLPNLPETLAHLAPGSQVLDIGAGRGVALSEIGTQHAVSVVATGIENTGDILTPCVLSVASDLPFADSSFDLVLSVHGVSWEPDQVGAIDEIWRVLKPGGQAHLLVLTFPHSMFLWYGESFWTRIGVEKSQYQVYEFAPEKYAKRQGFTVTSVDTNRENQPYRFKYYVEICKPLC
jgi:ubiquinone/menaquinone biosynthesis C-methylase UbiE